MTRFMAVLGMLIFAAVLGGQSASGQTLPGGGKLPGVGGKTPSLPGGAKLPGGGANPMDCGGDLGTSAAAVKIKAFLEAGAEVDKASASLEASVHDACRDMAKALEVSTDGNTKVLCNRVAAEIRNSLKVGVKGKAADVIAHFRKQVEAQGMKVVSEVNADETMMIAAEKAGSETPELHVMATQEGDMVTGSVTYGDGR